MNKTIVTFATSGFLCGAGLALSGTAGAVPFGGSSAADTVATLQSQGFSVQINGSQNVPLSRCTVTGVHGLPNEGVVAGTVFVDVDCTH